MCTSALLLVPPQPPPAESQPAAESQPWAEQPLTYYLPQQNNVLAPHNEDASRDVPILLAHVDALHGLVQHQVCCSDQETENKPRHRVFWLQRASLPSPEQQRHRSLRASRWALTGAAPAAGAWGPSPPKPRTAEDSNVTGAADQGAICSATCLSVFLPQKGGQSISAGCKRRGSPQVCEESL